MTDNVENVEQKDVRFDESLTTVERFDQTIAKIREFNANGVQAFAIVVVNENGSVGAAYDSGQAPDSLLAGWSDMEDRMRGVIAP